MSRSRSVSRICLLYAAGFGALGIASDANAQSQPAQANQSGATEEQKAQAAQETGDIVVTAQRREQSIQSVPASITAFGQAAITSLAISNVNDITRLTPGLVISRASGEGSSTSIAIRGIASLVGTSPTAIYIDDTPIQVRLLGAGQAAGSAYPAVFDLERIEVLKGPQGTLFGASSEGGTVRFITPSPDLNQWGGHARAEVSTVQSGGMGYQFGVAAGGPIVEDRLAVRLSAYAQRDGGWIDHQPYGGGASEKNVNDVETQAISAALLWRPVEGLSITPSIFWQQQQAGAGAFFWRNLSDPDRHRFVSGYLSTDPSRDSFVLPALKMQWDQGDVSIITNTSWLDHRLRGHRDYTFAVQEVLTGNYTGPNAPSTTYLSNPQKQFVQELRVQGRSLDGRLNWVIGGFYQVSRQRAYQSVVSPTLGDLIQNLYGVPIELALGSPLLPGGVAYAGTDESRDTQIAGFAQVDFKVLPKLTLTAGIRQAHSGFRFTNAQSGPFNGGNSAATGKASQNDTLPKFSVTYEATDNVRLYATAAKGFRPGGANAPVTTLCGPDLQLVGRTNSPQTYSSDTVWSYEAGAKGELLDHRLVWDVSAYVIRWRNIQNQVALPHCGFSYIDNLGKAESRGFEAQARVRPVEGLTAAFSLSYTDARYTQTIPSVSGNLVTDGQLLNAAPWQLSFALNYEARADLGGFRPYFHADNQYSSTFLMDDPANALFNPVTRRNGGVSLVAARIGLRRDNLDISVFAKNLLDTHPVTYTKWTVGSGLYADTTVAPRTLGVTITSNF
ncbi:MAG: TonB-dependent receptor [Sphingomonas bacterium]